MKSPVWPIAIFAVVILSFVTWQLGPDGSGSEDPITVAVPGSGKVPEANEPRVAQKPAASQTEKKPAGAPASSASKSPAVVSVNENGEEVINIGEYMDPDDPSTWPQDENQEVVNIGEYMDPDDPSTWPVAENSEVVDIGEYMNPDDPSTWPVSADSDATVVNIGEYRDPDKPQFWPVEGDGEVVNIGEYLDPDDPSSWPQK
jgi:hypothetical protein